MADLIGDSIVDPDAQAAVTDFLDYTEYLPSDLIRSLTLIRGLDETYLANSYAVHDFTRQYGSLPAVPPASRPVAQDLRSQISTSLDQALNARESAYAEACRLFDVADRHQNRLKSIIAKLHALPKPPSRDPTPQPPASIKRSRSGRKLEIGTSSQRLTVNPPRGNTVAAAILHRPHNRRRVTVPGEVLPPFDPDSPIASTEVSDWDSPPPSPPRPVLKLKHSKASKETQEAEKEKKPRAPREIVQYRKPTPPPEDAELGSKHRPWTYLTEYEMYKLRKKMKKNHTWQPSEVMIERELNDKNRGWNNYYKARAEAQQNGTSFVDIGDHDREYKKVDKAERLEKQDGVEKQPKMDRPERPEKADKPEKMDKVEITPVATPAAKPTVKDKQPVKRPESKKEKKEDVLQKQAALQAEEAARRLGDIGSAFKNLFSPLSNALASLNRSTSSSSIPTNSTLNAVKKPAAEKPSKKRKAEDAGVSASPSAESETQKKKQKIAPKPSPLVASEPPSSSAPPTPAIVPAPSAGTIKIPLKLNLAPASTSPSSVSAPVTATRAEEKDRASVAPKAESPVPAPSRPPSRRSLAASVEPGPVPSTRLSRRTSTTPAAAIRRTPVQETTPKPATTAASRRSKRDAPGTVTQSSQDGGAAVSLSNRKTKPNKQTKMAAAAFEEEKVPQIRIDVDGRQEIVDPDEERYCVCGDVSWGEMICCEFDEKVSLASQRPSHVNANMVTVRVRAMVPHGMCVSSRATATHGQVVLSRRSKEISQRRKFEWVGRTRDQVNRCMVGSNYQMCR